MKRIKSKCIQMQTVTFLVFTFLTCMVISSCEKTSDDNNSSNYREVLQNGGVYYSGCKGFSEKKTLAKEACITLHTVEGNYLEIQHFDAIFNCVFDSLSIDYNVNNNTISVDESHVNPNAYCTCEYDVKYRIGPLEYGTYSINILDENLNQNEISFDFEFSDNTQITYYKE